MKLLSWLAGAFRAPPASPPARARRSLENPRVSTLSDPDDWLLEAFGGTASRSGVRVSEETALRLDTVWRAISLIAGDVAKVPLHIYERGDEDDRRRATTHPAYRLLKSSPSPFVSSFHFRQSMMLRVLTRGNAYAAILRDRSFRPSALVPLHNCRPERKGSRLIYVARFETSDEEFELEQYDVFHLRGLGDGITGLSPIRYARDTIGNGLSAGFLTADFYENAAVPSLAASHPETLSDSARANLRRSIRESHQGHGNRFGVLVLEEGLDVKPISLSLEDALVVETAKLSIVQIANIFGVPPHKLGGDGRTSYSSLEQENREYLASALDVWFCAFEAEAREKLLTERQKAADSHYVEFERNALIRTSTAERFSAYDLGIKAGILSPDEVRAKENLPPRPDGLGGVYFVQPGVMPAEAASKIAEKEAASSPSPDPAPPRDDDGPEAEEARRARERAVEHIHRRFLLRFSRRLASAGKDPARFGELADSWEAEYRGLLEREEEALGPALGVSPGSVAGPFCDAVRGLLEGLHETAVSELPRAAARAAKDLELRLSRQLTERTLER